jgi:hypothetical protein
MSPSVAQLRSTIAVVTCVYALWLFPAWQPEFLSERTVVDGLDSGWAFALNAFHASGLQFGHDIIFTYGPLGFLEPRLYHPATYHVVLLRSVFTAVVLWVALWSLASRARWGPITTLTVVVALTTLAALARRTTDHSSEYFFCVLFLVTQFHHRETRQPLAWWLLLLSIALSGLVKFSYFAAGAVAVGASALDDLRCRRIPRAAVTFVIAFVIFYLAAGQRLSSLVGYLQTSGEIASAYSTAMMLPGPVHEIVWFLIVGSVFLVVAGRSIPTGGGARAAIFAAGLCGIGWIVFKQGFVRQDLWHVLPAAIQLAMIVTVCAPIALSRSRTAKGALLWCSTGVAAVVLALSAAHEFMLSEPGRRITLGSALYQNTRGIWQLLSTQTNAFDREHGRSISQLATNAGVSPDDGAVDVYPWDVWIPLVNQLVYRPRPVFQSYAAYTSKLADINARHLLNASAPDTLLFEVKNVDGRLPSLDDAPSWPIILSTYEIRSVIGARVVLSRSGEARPVAMNVLHRSVQRIGEAFALPHHDGPLMIAIDLQPSTAGRVWAAAFRGPAIALEVRTRDGQLRRFTYVQSLAGVPFLISPLIVDTPPFVALARGQLSPEHLVDRVAVKSLPEDSWKLEQAFNVTVTTFETPRIPPRQP